MVITEVRVKLVNRPNDKLRAFCSITLDNALVVRDLKIIEGAKGPFVAMPSRKLTDRCPKCGGKNHLRANFCNDCGARLPVRRKIAMEDGRQKLYADVAHPIHAQCREEMQGHILRMFREELEKSKLPGYRPVALSDDDEGFEEEFSHADAAPGREAAKPRAQDAPAQ